MVRESSARDHRSATTRRPVERGAQQHQQQLGFVGDSSSSRVGSSDVQSMSLVRHTKGLTDEIATGESCSSSSIERDPELLARRR